jgi:hypothetical protein
MTKKDFDRWDFLKRAKGLGFGIHSLNKVVRPFLWLECEQVITSAGKRTTINGCVRLKIERIENGLSTNVSKDG